MGTCLGFGMIVLLQMQASGACATFEPVVSEVDLTQSHGLIRAIASAIACAAFCLGCAPTQQTAQNQVAGNAGCRARTTVVGMVNNGERFEHDVAGYLFVLEPMPRAPPNPRGWTIRIYLRDGPPNDLSGDEDDLSWAATAPWHSSNARVIVASDDQSLEEAISWTPRGFDFYQDRTTNRLAVAWVVSQLGRREAGAPADWPTPQGHGEFRIRNVVLGGPANDRYIAQMVFDVEICLLAR